MTRRGDSWVYKGDLVGIVDLISLHITRQDLHRAMAGLERAVRVAGSLRLSAGLVITGTEVYEGRIKDLAEDRIRAKLETYECRLTDKVIVPDDEATISQAVSDMTSSHDLVVVTGGMSVDPTDVTARAILGTGAKMVMYGFPIKPTTMSLLAYLNGKPVIGLSAGVIYFARENVLDVLLPRICAGGSWSKEELAALGNGGIMKSFLDEVGKKGISHGRPTTHSLD
jgi:molybdopterin biosynthesis enzyme